MEKMIIDIILVIFRTLSFLLHFVSSLSVPNSHESRLLADCLARCLGFLGPVAIPAVDAGEATRAAP